MFVIGLISDTHLAGKADMLPAAVLKAFAEVDQILHAGDLVTLEMLSQLQDLAPVRAVHGNACKRDAKEKLPAFLKLKLAGWKVGLLHAAFLTAIFIESYSRKLYKIAALNDLDIMVCGHLHKPLRIQKGKVLIVNPGSPTCPLWGAPPTVAVLRLGPKSRKVKFVRV
jgi:hypothetical protein